MKKLTIAAATLAASLTVASAQTFVNSNITTDTTWTTAGAPYILDTTIFVNNNATLTIEPGVVVRGQIRVGATVPGSLVVTTAGSIVASSDPNDPIIFTTAAIDVNGDDIADAARYTGSEPFLDATPKAAPLAPIDGAGNANEQLWGGLVVLGVAPTSVGTDTADQGNAAAQVFHIEGLPKTVDSQYGGNETQDNSGIIRYVSIRHGGDQIGTANEINGLTMGGVGAGTTIEFVEIYCNFDDGFEFFGGTVNTRYLVSTYAGDDQFDGDQGWVGVNQYWFAVMPYFAIGSSNGDEGFEFDGDDGDTPVVDHNTNSDGDLAPLADYAVYNATIVGNAEVPSLPISVNGGINLKARFGGSINSSLFINTTVPVFAGFNANGAELVQNSFNNGALSPLVGSFVADTTAALAGATVNEGNVVNVGDGFFAVNLAGDDITFGSTGGLDPRPAVNFIPGSVNNTILEPALVESNGIRGAFDAGAATLWTTGWTVLNTVGALVD